MSDIEWRPDTVARVRRSLRAMADARASEATALRRADTSAAGPDLEDLLAETHRGWADHLHRSRQTCEALDDALARQTRAHGELDRRAGS